MVTQQVFTASSPYHTHITLHGLDLQRIFETVIRISQTHS